MKRICKQEEVQEEENETRMGRRKRGIFNNGGNEEEKRRGCRADTKAASFSTFTFVFEVASPPLRNIRADLKIIWLALAAATYYSSLSTSSQ